MIYQKRILQLLKFPHFNKMKNHITACTYQIKSYFILYINFIFYLPTFKMSMPSLDSNKSWASSFPSKATSALKRTSCPISTALTSDTYLYQLQNRINRMLCYRSNALCHQKHTAVI